MGSGDGAVLVETPVGLFIFDMAAGKFLVALLLFSATEGKRTLRGNARTAADNRDARSLVNTFPFNANGGNEHHGNHHGNHHDTHVSFPSVAAARPGNDGKRCIDKVEMIEETEY